MAAIIRSLRNGAAAVSGASRNDLVIGDLVTVNSVDAATTYSWSLAYVPEGSAAAFSGDVTAVSPGSFTVDLDGAYLVRLTVDAGLGTESTQYVRTRALTVLGSLELVAAGERRDSTGIIPVDISAEGWANEQNGNLLTLLGLVGTVSASGRIFYVDPTAGYADYTSVQDAINAAEAQVPTSTTPWIIAVRPGLYTEDITFKPHIHVIGWPGSFSDVFSSVSTNYMVMIRCANSTGGISTHTVSLPGAGDVTVVANLSLENAAATTNATLVKTGSGTLIMNACHVLQSAISGTQGAALDVQGGTTLTNCCAFTFPSGGAVNRIAVLQSGANTYLVLANSIVNGPSCITLNPNLNAGVATVILRSSLTASGGPGAWGIRSDAMGLILEQSSVTLTGGGGPALHVHSGAGVTANAISVIIRWSLIGGGITFDITNVGGATSLTLTGSDYGALTYPGGAPTVTAGQEGTSVFYNNATTGMVAENVQTAIDEVYGLATLIQSLDNAYNGVLGGALGAGNGRTIYANNGAVQILDNNPPSATPPAGSSDGKLQVLGAVEIGAVGSPEILNDPNLYGNGPFTIGGQTIWAANAPFGSTWTVMGRSTGNPTFYNYNLRLQTESTNGGGTVGRVTVRGGDGYDNAGAGPNAADVHIRAGDAFDTLAGAPGYVYVSPGLGALGPTSGTMRLVNPADSTATTLTAAGVFVGGVAGDVTFATNMGAVTASILAGDNLATVQTKLAALPGIISAAGDPIVLTTTALGPDAELFFLSADAGVDAALGVFDGQVPVMGTYTRVVDIACTGDQEVTIGAPGGLPMVYNGTTGKLTVPGIIDPTAMILDRVAAPAATAGKETIFVSDGSGGLTTGRAYFLSDGSPSGLFVLENADGSVDAPGGVLTSPTATPSTSATQLAVFVSDGTGGLTAGRLYVRESSDGTTAPIAKGAAEISSDLMTVPQKVSRIAPAVGNFPYTITATDQTVEVSDTSAPRTVLLSSPVSGRRITIRDTGGNAAANNITINGSGATIDGATTFTIQKNNGSVVLVADGTNWFTEAKPSSRRDLTPYHLRMNGMANGTETYYGWVAVPSRIMFARVFMNSVNTQGNYTLTMTNVGTGGSMLGAASFDMNTLVAATVTTLALSSPPDTVFGTVISRWNIALTSDSAAFDGSGIFIELVFEAT